MFRASASNVDASKAKTVLTVQCSTKQRRFFSCFLCFSWVQVQWPAVYCTLLSLTWIISVRGKRVRTPYSTCDRDVDSGRCRCRSLTASPLRPFRTCSRPRSCRRPRGRCGFSSLEQRGQRGGVVQRHAGPKRVAEHLRPRCRHCCQRSGGGGEGVVRVGLLGHFGCNRSLHPLHCHRCGPRGRGRGCRRGC